MSTSLVAGYLPNITSEQLGTANAPAVSIMSERTSAMTSIAPRQHDSEDSFVSVWVMLGAILSCLAIMMAVVIAAATSVS
jgi:hypothetical protein